ncbi:MAG: Ribonuclease [Bacteroidota bacterium]|jgi:ribonuclease P protein component
MLSKKHRVNKGVFEAIMKDSIMVSSPLFTFRYIPSVDNTVHFAVVAPKSIAKTAVIRNSLRRKGYRIAKPLLSKPFIGALFYKKEALKAENAQISENITFLLKKAGLI